MAEPTLTAELKRLKVIIPDLLQVETVEAMFLKTQEEMGELAHAILHESKGFARNKTPPKEKASDEAADVVMCNVILFFALGGTTRQLIDRFHDKREKILDKLTTVLMKNPQVTPTVWKQVMGTPYAP